MSVLAAWRTVAQLASEEPGRGPQANGQVVEAYCRSGSPLPVHNRQVAEAYCRSGFEADPSLSMLQMLTAMEVRLMELASQVRARRISQTAGW